VPVQVLITKIVPLVALLLGLTLLWLELRHRLRPASPLQLRAQPFQVQAGPDGLTVVGEVTITNPHPRMEVFVPEIKLHPVLLGQGDLRGVQITSRVVALHPDEETRSDNYWAAYIVKGRKSTCARLEISLQGAPAAIAQLDTLWIELLWVNYGPFGRLHRRDGVLVPLRQPTPITAEAAPWREGDRCQVLAVGTHLLGVLDDPETVLRHYSGQLLAPGDVLTIGETPLAVMQGRYHHPATVEPSALARLLCRVFHPTSSLATACGLQSLIDVEGPARILGAWLIGTALKAIGLKGWFYRLAGEQARLIDDITGTTPPYDQTIVLGPHQPQAFCASMARSLGVGVAVVDVNDLGRVKVLAASQGCDHDLLQRALRPNPAGNANERTPLVLVRPR
jgi:hypothetical protein